MSLDILCPRLVPLVLHPSPDSGYISGAGLPFTHALIQQASVLCRVLCWARGGGGYRGAGPSAGLWETLICKQICAVCPLGVVQTDSVIDSFHSVQWMPPLCVPGTQYKLGTTQTVPSAWVDSSL